MSTPHVDLSNEDLFPWVPNCVRFASSLGLFAGTRDVNLAMVEAGLELREDRLLRRPGPHIEDRRSHAAHRRGQCR